MEFLQPTQCAYADDLAVASSSFSELRGRQHSVLSTAFLASLFDIRMMVFLVLLTVPSAAPMLLSQCVNPDQLNSERLENNLRLCGENWLTNKKFSSLIEMTKVYSSSLHSILVHKFSASKFVEMELENRFSSLLRLVVDKRFTLVTPDLSVPGIFRLRCCNGFSLESTGLMCDGCPLASPLFRRLAGRGVSPFFCYCFDGFHAWRPL